MSTTAPAGPRSKRRLILDAAIDNFGEVGFEHTKWATIADQVGIGQTALYHYFESKAHCLLTIMSTELERSHERFVAVTQGVASAEEQLRASVRAAIAVEPREALQARILLSHQDLLVAPRVSEREEAERQKSRDLVRQIEQDWSAMLALGIEQGAFSDRDTKTGARLMLGLLNSVWRWYRPSGSQTLDQVADEVVEACLRLAH
ncbi:TetR/AcrR family transcriptional regulator [Nocardioides yefusunii]|uniref:TetR/AcrR family transcriptional regulator n=1 Tax=Nocardioides yefusunii TaxID=2500546 RepID=A0ABW1QWA7_9ACTN|nr:TetR/AcrR family transcriptional regulator [Nocardioides yefusunii]